MVKSISQLRKEIAEQRRIVAKEQKTKGISSKAITERQKLNRELFELRNRKLIAIGQRTRKGLIFAGKKAKRLSARFGRGVLKAGEKIAPVIKKQARLISDQQLRDDKIAAARAKVKRKFPKKKARAKQPSESGIFGNLDF